MLKLPEWALSTLRRLSLLLESTSISGPPVLGPWPLLKLTGSVTLASFFCPLTTRTVPPPPASALPSVQPGHGPHFPCLAGISSDVLFVASHDHHVQVVPLSSPPSALTSLQVLSSLHKPLFEITLLIDSWAVCFLINKMNTVSAGSLLVSFNALLSVPGTT